MPLLPLYLQQFQHRRYLSIIAFITTYQPYYKPKEEGFYGRGNKVSPTQGIKHGSEIQLKGHVTLNVFNQSRSV